jgi:ABC-type sugar transport system ATPase subunit
MVSGGAINFEGCALALDPAFAAAHDGEPVTVAIRPDKFRLPREGEPSFSAQVDFVEFLGDAAFVYAQSASGARIVRRGDRTALPSSGDRLEIAVDTSDVLLFDAAGKRLRR